MTHPRPFTPHRISALCGMAAPVLFAVTVLLVGFLTPEYNPVTQHMSELGIPGEPYAMIMNGVGLVLAGILLAAFSYATYRAFPPGWRGAFGSGMIIAAGLSFVAMGFFSCDQGCIPVTLAGTLHQLFGLIAVIAAVLAALVFSFIMHREKGWEGYWQYSLLTGILVLVILQVFLSQQDYAGLLQRIMVGIILLWTELFAIRIFRLEGEG